MKMRSYGCDINGSSSSLSFLLLLLLLGVSNYFLLLEAAEIHYHDFVVQQTAVRRMCDTYNIITVNGMYPGPILQIRNGDFLVINVVNRAQYNVTIHWHGVRQRLTAWADGPEFVTQCPIRPGGSYTYRFAITGQEGTLWWHAHSSWLRATVYGAIAIYPKEGTTYPFKEPHREFPVILGEWWNANPIAVVREALRTGAAPNISNAYTINGQPGDLYNCSTKDTTTFRVRRGENILLRVINAALNQELYFSIGNHIMTVVGIDASYTKPFSTNLLMLGPGQTTDVLITTDQFPGKYYMAARAFASAPNVPFGNTTTTAILRYTKYGCSSKASPRSPRPLLPALPAFNDTLPARAFASGLRSPSAVKIPEPVDVNLMFTVGVGLFNCRPGQNCGGPNNTRLTASMNNISYVSPTNYSILQAHLLGFSSVFKANFPQVPPLKFNYTSTNIPRELWQPMPGTEVLSLRYGSVVQLVFQGTSIFTPENHPMHIHGYDFYVLATGSGNFNETTDTAKFNLIDPPRRNTVAVPAGGWAVIRFLADNPGAWIMHCHLDVHLTWGLAMVLLVENGVGEWQSLGPPPPDLPLC